MIEFVVIANAPFYSINFWAFPIMLIFTFGFLISMPCWKMAAPRFDKIFMFLVGLNIGAFVDIIGKILPDYMLIVTVLPTVLFMVLS